MMPGFRGGSFRHIIAYHRRAQGTAAGMPRARFEAGRTAYVIGSSPLFMVARAGRRMVGNQPVVVGVLLLAGSIWTVICADCRGRRLSSWRGRFVANTDVRYLMIEPMWRRNRCVQTH
jgi:hypothetical protein